MKKATSRGYGERGHDPSYPTTSSYAAHRCAGIAVAIHSVVALAAQAFLNQFNSLVAKPGVQGITDVASTAATGARRRRNERT